MSHKIKKKNYLLNWLKFLNKINKMKKKKQTIENIFYNKNYNIIQLNLLIKKVVK